MRLLFLIQGFEVASSRYRVLQYVPALQEAGFDVTVTPFPRKLGEQQRVYSDAGEYDLVFIHRKRLSKYWIRKLRATAKKIVYDFDDAVMYRDTLSIENQESERRKRRFERTCRVADLVIAGSGYLASFARPLNANTAVLPTVVDLSRYAPRSWNDKPEKITLGWIGDTGSFAYLESQRPLFEAVGQAIPRLQFKIVSSRFPRFDHLPVIARRWSADGEVADLQSFDIGIMPIQDDPWSKGKCGLKLLQYMAAGVPAVASPVGANLEILADGVQGFYAAGQKEWIERIGRLAGDARLREKMGKAAFQRVKEAYALQVAAPKFVELLRKTAANQS